MKRMSRFFSKRRLLDGYISTLGFTIHYKLLATYGETTCYLISLTIGKLFHFDITWHVWSQYHPKITSSFSIFSIKIFDTAARGNELVRKSLDAFNRKDREQKIILIEQLGDKIKLAESYSKLEHVKI